MFYGMLFIVSVGLVHQVISGNLHQTKIKLVGDIIENYKQPAAIVFILCSKSESWEFFKSFSTYGYRTTVLKLDSKDLPRPFPPNNGIFVADMSCPKIPDVLKKADDMQLFSSPFRWILMSHNDSQSMENAVTLFSTVSILLDSQLIWAKKESDEMYTLHELYKRKINQEVIINRLGFWSGKTGLKYNAGEKLTCRRRKDLKKTNLDTSIVITHNNSLNHLTDKREKHIDSIAKVNYVLMMHLSDILNATFIYSVEQTWGYKNKNTSEWSGMIGRLVRKEADIGGTALFVTIDRVPIIDYIAMTTPTRSKFVFRAPKLSYETNVYALPFHWSVWASTVSLMALAALALYPAIKWEWKRNRSSDNQEETNEIELRDHWLEVIFLEFGAFCQQGASALPYSVAGRIIIIFLYITLMFLYNSYSGTIVALLQSSSSKIKTLNDLLHSRLDVGVDDTVFNHFFFPNATEPVRRALYLQKVSPPNQKSKFYPMEVGVAKMREGLFAFHMETGAGYKVVGETFQEDEKCGLQEIQFLQVTDPYVAIQKNSSYKKILKIGLRILQESGIQKREVSLIYTSKPHCISRGNSFVSVGIIDCYFAVVIFIGGLLISVAVFIFELIVHRRAKAFKERKAHWRRMLTLDVWFKPKHPNKLPYIN